VDQVVSAVPKPMVPVAAPAAGTRARVAIAYVPTRAGTHQRAQADHPMTRGIGGAPPLEPTTVATMDGPTRPRGGSGPSADMSSATDFGPRGTVTPGPGFRLRGPVFVPIGLLVGAALSVLLHPGLAWLLIGVTAGYSLSGST
jgi:hypothetical protein